jgi:hypothetical protein
MKEIRRVGDQKTPRYIEDQFFPTANFEDEDPYAELRARRSERSASISRERGAWEQERAGRPERDWEGANRPARMTRDARKFNPIDEEMSNLYAEDVSSRAIRRAGYATDDATKSHRPDFFLTREEAQMMVEAGGVFFDPDLEKICWESSLNQLEARARQASRLEKVERSNRKKREWERRQSKALREKNIVTARAHPILANRANMIMSAEEEGYDVGSRFGMHDYSDTISKDEERIRLASRKRRERLRIKPQGVDRADRVRDWSENINPVAARFQDVDYGWIDTDVYTG